MKNNWPEIRKILTKGGVAVLPTDTIYGLASKALDPRAVLRVYEIKGRDKNKPLIVLISSLSDLEKFKIKLSKEEKKILASIWPGKVSVILGCKDNKFKYLHRGTKSIAFRMVGPRNPNLFKLLKNVGPLVAPSANIQGGQPAKNIWEAKKYFGDRVDIYVCGHTRVSKPSTLLKIKNGKIEVLRQGEFVLKI